MTISAGQQLRQAREERSIPLEQIAQATRIRLRYLQAIEAGDFTGLPSPAQARGFIRAYAGYLKIDPEPVLAALADEAPFLSVSPVTRPAHALALPEEDEPGETEAIFPLIGQKLRNQRELLGLSLEDVERHTFLRIHYLKTLEAGDWKGLPSPVQGRGMLKNYATFLGLDPEPLLLRYAEGLQARLEIRQASKPKRASSRKPVRRASFLQRLLSLDILSTAFVVLFLGGFLVWGAFRVLDIRSLSLASTITPTSPSVADVLLAASTASLLGQATQTETPEPTATETPSGEGELSTGPAGLTEATQAGDPGTPPAGTPQGEQPADSLTSTPEIPALGSAPVQLHLIVRQRAWMRVTVDGKVEFEGRVIPGSAYPFTGDQTVEVLTGNGAALQVFFNQEDLGSLGLFGELVDVVFTPQGLLLPTPTPTATAEPTGTVTPTGGTTGTPSTTPPVAPGATTTPRP